MSSTSAEHATSDLSAAVARNLPYLRRYARALTGSQDTGDRFAEATLESILQDSAMFASTRDPKIALFEAFHLVWSSAGAPLGEPDTRLSAVAQDHMASLTQLTRQALLLNAIEGFHLGEIAQIMRTDVDDVQSLIKLAIAEMEGSVAGKVLVIEDEAIIAMDISAIIREMGHAVTGIARTRTEAVALAASNRPDLVLADIQLADNSSGIDAVNDILRQFDDLPVVFVTAFPERLLTGTRPEPAFLITKPFSEEQVRSAVSQAMFFASTETLVG